MDDIWTSGAIVSVVAFSLCFIAIIEMIYVHYRYQKNIDKKLCEKNGDVYIGHGLLIDAMWLGGYGAYCLFPRLARRDGHEAFFASLPRNQRYHLIFIFLTNSTGAILLIVSYVMTEYLGL